MSKHWPAPWVWDRAYPARLVDAEGHIVCETMPSSAEANMPLLKAAPDLLQALKGMMKSSGALDGRPESDNLAEKAARLAIAKAEGR